MNLDNIDEILGGLEETATGWWSDIAPEHRKFMEAINIAKQLLAVVRREQSSISINPVESNKPATATVVNNNDNTNYQNNNDQNRMSNDEKIILDMSNEIKKKDLIIESMYEHLEGAKGLKDKNKEITELYNSITQKHNMMIDMYSKKDSELKECYDGLIKTNKLLVEQTEKVNKYESNWVVKKFLK